MKKGIDGFLVFLGTIFLIAAIGLICLWAFWDETSNDKLKQFMEDNRNKRLGNYTEEPISIKPNNSTYALNTTIEIDNDTLCINPNLNIIYPCKDEEAFTPEINRTFCLTWANGTLDCRTYRWYPIDEHQGMIVTFIDDLVVCKPNGDCD